MDIQQIIAAAPTTCNTYMQPLTNGQTEAILNFGTRKAATQVAKDLRAAGATVKPLQPTPYKEWILVAYWATV